MEVSVSIARIYKLPAVFPMQTISNTITLRYVCYIIEHVSQLVNEGGISIQRLGVFRTCVFPHERP